MEDGGRLGKGPAPLALPGPMGPPGVPRPGAVEADCAVGLLAGREGGVDIWFCCSKRRETARQAMICERQLSTKTRKWFLTQP